MVPEYGVEIVVGVASSAGLTWFMSEKELWFLDLRKLVSAFGGDPLDPQNYRDRFDLPVVDRDEWDTFMAHMAEFRCAPAEVLAAPIAEASSWDEVSACFPTLLIDPEQRRLSSLFPEPASFEHHIPDGWSGDATNFLARIPVHERYWVVDEVHHLLRLGGTYDPL